MGLFGKKKSSPEIIRLGGLTGKKHKKTASEKEKERQERVIARDKATAEFRSKARLLEAKTRLRKSQRASRKSAFETKLFPFGDNAPRKRKRSKGARSLRWL